MITEAVRDMDPKHLRMESTAEHPQLGGRKRTAGSVELCGTLKQFRNAIELAVGVSTVNPAFDLQGRDVCVLVDGFRAKLFAAKLCFHKGRARCRFCGNERHLQARVIE